VHAGRVEPAEKRRFGLGSRLGREEIDEAAHGRQVSARHSTGLTRGFDITSRAIG
jgi:hypothetical protein